MPRIFGDYGPIKRDYPVEEFVADAHPHGVEKSVYVQVNWSPDQAEDEVAWVQGVHDAHGYPHAIVGFADLTAEDCLARLDRLAAFPAMRGIRMQLHWHQNPLYRFAPGPEQIDDPHLRDNLKRLPARGWLFELQVFAGQMEAAARLVKDCPEVTFVLEHAGMLEDTSEAGIARWREGLDRLAALPNISTKLSGLGTFSRALDPEHIRFVIAEAVSRFGPERCLWGSNFPIEKIWTSYGAILDAVDGALVGQPQGARRAILHDTAARLYRI